MTDLLLQTALIFPDAEEIYCEEFEKAIDQIQIGGNDYVTVVTRGHRFDLTCLRKVLSGIFPRYLGMMGSKRRWQELLICCRKKEIPGK